MTGRELEELQFLTVRWADLRGPVDDGNAIEAERRDWAARELAGRIADLCVDAGVCRELSALVGVP